MYNKKVEAFIEQPVNAIGLFDSFKVLNLTQAKDLLSDLQGHVYWVESKCGFQPHGKTLWLVRRYHKMISVLNSLIDRNWFGLETNSRGNTITRRRAENFLYFYIENVTSEPGEYLYDETHRSCITLPQELKIISFSEGDVTVVTCATIESYESELQAIQAWESEHA